MAGIKFYHLQANCAVMSLRKPFRSDRCRLRLTFHESAADFPSRTLHRHYTVDLAPTSEAVLCAIQQLNRWLIDRRKAAADDVERAKRYRSGDHVYK